MQNNKNSSVATINLKSLCENYKLILTLLSKGSECAAVLKSDAYGFGISKVFTKLSSLGCSKFFVSTLEEAIYLRTLSLTDEIYILNGVLENEEKLFYEHNLIPVLNYPDQAELWINYAKRKQTKLPSAINIDTGANKLGMSSFDARKLFENNITDNLKIMYLLSDLISYNEDQYNQVLEFSKFADNIPISLCNIDAVPLEEKYHFDLVRVGAAIYGLNEFKNTITLKRVLGLSSFIIQIRKITQENFLGYESNYKLNSGSKIAIVKIGYADGVPYSLGDVGHCFISSIKTSIIGKISLDILIIDVTNVPDKCLYEGAEVEIIGDQISIEEIADYSKISSCAIASSIAQKCEKIYLE